MFKLLTKFGVPNRSFHMTKKLYKKFKPELSVRKLKSVGYTTDRKLGDNLAPILFIIVI